MKRSFMEVLKLVKAGYTKKEIDEMGDEDEKVEPQVEPTKTEPVKLEKIEKKENKSESKDDPTYTALCEKIDELTEKLGKLEATNAGAAVKASEIPGEPTLEESLLQFLPKGYELNK